MTQLILASASIGREYLLKGLKIPYRIIPSKIDEDKIVGKNLVETVKMRARMKGENVSGLLSRSPKPALSEVEGLLKLLKSLKEKTMSTLILSADTEVILGNRLLGKPKDYKDAVRMLKMLSGKTHEVVTAVYLLKLPKSPKSLKKLTYDRSRVTFRKLTKEDIKLYLSITEYTRYTGSYALIASPQNFITKIERSISNVIGLPLEKVIPVFRKLKMLT